MSKVELRSVDVKGKSDDPHAPPPPATDRGKARHRIRFRPFLVTLGAVLLAALLSWVMWQAYMEAPWTRDGTVRVYAVTLAPEVAGKVVQLPVIDNQFVHKGDLLMLIEPTDYTIALSHAEAAVEQAKALALNA